MSVQPCKCFYFWTVLFLHNFYGACEVFKNAFSCTLKTFNILENFYDACKLFENVFKNSFNCILKTIKDSFYDACEVFENVTFSLIMNTIWNLDG